MLYPLIYKQLSWHLIRASEMISQSLFFQNVDICARFGLQGLAKTWRAASSLRMVHQRLLYVNLPIHPSLLSVDRSITSSVEIRNRIVILGTLDAIFLGADGPASPPLVGGDCIVY